MYMQSVQQEGKNSSIMMSFWVRFWFKWYGWTAACLLAVTMATSSTHYEHRVVVCKGRDQLGSLAIKATDIEPASSEESWNKEVYGHAFSCDSKGILRKEILGYVMGTSETYSHSGLLNPWSIFPILNQEHCLSIWTRDLLIFKCFPSNPALVLKKFPLACRFALLLHKLSIVISYPMIDLLCQNELCSTMREPSSVFYHLRTLVGQTAYNFQRHKERNHSVHK